VSGGSAQDAQWRVCGVPRGKNVAIDQVVGGAWGGAALAPAAGCVLAVGVEERNGVQFFLAKEEQRFGLRYGVRQRAWSRAAETRASSRVSRDDWPGRPPLWAHHGGWSEESVRRLYAYTAQPPRGRVRVVRVEGG